VENLHPLLPAPTAVNVTVRQRQRPREYLTEREIERLMKAAGNNRWGHRDATAILLAYRHGLRARACGFDSPTPISDSAQVPLAAIHTPPQVAIALAGGVAVQTHLTKQSSMARSPDFFIGLSAGGFHAQAQRKMDFVLHKYFFARACTAVL
jgi:hypothetical protein